MLWFADWLYVFQIGSVERNIILCVLVLSLNFDVLMYFYPVAVRSSFFCVHWFRHLEIQVETRLIPCTE